MTRRNPNLGVMDAGVEHGSGWRDNLGKSSLSMTTPRPSLWWTGKPPVPGVCPGIDSDGKLRLLAPPDLTGCNRADVLAYFDNGWTMTEVLFSALTSDEAMYRPPYHGLRHPLIFYYAHPAVLYVNKLRLAGLLSTPVDEYFESLFETGVDEMSWDDMSKNEIDWPPIEQVLEYRRKVYKLVKEVIEQHFQPDEPHPVIDFESPLWSLFMGFEHERIHLETTSVLIRELPAQLVKTPPEMPQTFPTVENPSTEPREGIDYPISRFVEIEAGSAEIGKQEPCRYYGWDNEYGHRRADVGSFEVSNMLVSNGEFWQFVKAGGYCEEKYWDRTGWSWRSFRNIKCPTFWIPNGPTGSHHYKLRTTFEIVPMQWNWPVVVNYHETKAYLRWRAEKDGKPGRYRLPTEMEHNRIRTQTGQTGLGEKVLSNSANLPPAPKEPAYNLNLRYGSEAPVDSMESENIEVLDLFGNVWHWLEDDFNPLDGFKIHPYYDDFSTPCFDGEHQMILGGSFISAGDMSLSSARFHFRPHFFQHAGFRVVNTTAHNNGAVIKLGGAIGKDSSAHGNDRYKNERMLQRYVNLHYGSREDQMPYSSGPEDGISFPARAARLLIDWCDRFEIAKTMALDVGCSVGGASFALAEQFDHVTAVDLSQSLIGFARELQTNGRAEYKIFEEGEIYERREIEVPRQLLDKVTFKRADACSLPSEFVDYDAAIIANLLCRLPSPMSLLSRLAGSRGIVRKGGLVLITSPFSWMEQLTPREVWLGGRITASGPQWSFDGLKAAMEDAFELVAQHDMPMIIRENRRKYHYIVPMATVWRRFA